MSYVAAYGLFRSFVESDLLSKIEKVLDGSTTSLDIGGGEYSISRTKDNITVRRATNSKTSEPVFVKVGSLITNSLSPYDVAKIKEAINRSYRHLSNGNFTVLRRTKLKTTQPRNQWIHRPKWLAVLTGSVRFYFLF